MKTWFVLFWYKMSKMWCQTMVKGEMIPIENIHVSMVLIKHKKLVWKH